MWNDCDEATVNYVADVHGRPVLDLTGKHFAREEDEGQSDLGDSSPHHEKREVRKQDSAEEIENINLLRGGPDGLEGNLYAFLIQ